MNTKHGSRINLACRNCIYYQAHEISDNVGRTFNVLRCSRSVLVGSSKCKRIRIESFPLVIKKPDVYVIVECSLNNIKGKNIHEMKERIKLLGFSCSERSCKFCPNLKVEVI